MLVNFASIIDKEYVAAQKIGSNIAQLNSEKFGLIMSNIPINPTNIAEILYRPTSFFKINLVLNLYNIIMYYINGKLL